AEGQTRHDAPYSIPQARIAWARDAIQGADAREAPSTRAGDERSLSSLKVGVVADVARRHHEDDVLGDIGRVVANPLEVPGNQDEVQRRLNRAGVLQHVGEELTENLRLE